MPTPPVSVVIPLYNKQATIRGAIRSVLEQTFRDFELIVVDDGSTDESCRVVSSIDDDRLRLIRQRNGGVSAARNRGIEESSGELVAFLDADDWWDPRFLEAVAALAVSFPEAGLYATGSGRCWQGARPDVTTSVRFSRSTCGLVDSYFSLAGQGDFVNSSCVAVRRTALLEVGGFPVGESWGEDRDTWVRLALRHPVACDSRILAWYATPESRYGRGQLRVRPEWPPAVRTLLRAIVQGEVPGAVRAQADSYLDWNTLGMADTLLWHSERSVVRAFLDTAPSVTSAGRNRLRLRRWLCALFPKRIAGALLWRGERLAERLAAFSPRAVSGNAALRREHCACVHCA